MNKTRWIVGAAVLFLVACGDDDDCHQEQLQVQEVCNTTTVAPGQPLVIDVATEMTDACGPTACMVERQGGDIVVQVEVNRCTDRDPNVACDLAGARCELPALDEGGYALRVNGSPFGMIHVDAASTGTECQF
jgi:hypothetical protein